jgi:tRNA modification GTPase
VSGAPRLAGARARELTPRGAGAVAVVELAGEGALAAARALGAPARLAPGEARLARLALGAQIADDALVVARAPDRVELHLHGSPVLVRAALARCAPADVPRGLAARASALLADAVCEDAARLLLDQAEGALSRELARIAGLEADAARAAAAELAARGRLAQRALVPADVVLAGPVNAGKSTLYNALLGEERALVADEPGTTRDVLAAVVLLGSWPARVHDTAGERAAAAPVEVEGQRRARALRDQADLVLWLAPAGTPAVAPPGARLLVTQADRVSAAPRGAISARADPAGARAVVGELFRARLGLPARAWTPGAAVPFAPDQLEALEAAARGARDAREAARALLADGA